MIENIHWLGHAGFKINAPEGTLYIDPWQLSESREKADVLLLTHEHYDHFSPEDIAKIRTPKTIVLGPMQCWQKMNDLRNMYPNMHARHIGVNIDTVRAYNTDKVNKQGTPFHPRNDEKLGYVLEVSGQRIYHAGDTDIIPEMHKLGKIDIALLPVSGTYVMTPEEAAAAVEIIKPKIAVPMHWGSIVGTQEDAERFKQLATCEVIIPEKE